MRDRQDFQAWRRKLDDQRDLLLGMMAVDIPGISEKLEDRSPALRHHRTQFNNRIGGARLGIAVAARSPDSADREAAQRVENLDYAFYQKVREETDAERRSTDQQTTRGCGILHLEWCDDAKEKLRGRSAKGAEELVKLITEEGLSFTDIPFTVTAPSLTATFWEPDRRMFCEIGERKVSELCQAYPDHGDLREYLTGTTTPEWETFAQTTAKVYHLETKEHIYDVIERADNTGEGAHMLQTTPTFCGRPWYVLVPGHDNSEDNVDDKYEALIGPLYTVVQRLNILGTLLGSGAIQTGRATYQLVKAGARSADTFGEYLQMPANERPVLRHFSQQAVVTPPTGFEYIVLPIPDQQWLFSAYQAEEAKLDRWGFPSALATDAPAQGDTTSGYHAARQMEAAADFLEYALSNRALAWKMMFQLLHDVVQALNVSITVPVQLKAQGRGPRVQQITKLLPGDLKEHRLEVTLKSVPASVQMAIEENLMRRHEMGMISQPSIMEQFYDDPSDEQKRIDLEQIRAPMKEMALQDALAIVQEHRGALMEEAQLAANVPLPPETDMQGGPEVPGGVRNARPPGGAFPNLGAPAMPPEQATEGVPPSMGTEMTAEVT